MAKGDVEDVGVYESDEGYVEKDVVEEQVGIEKELNIPMSHQAIVERSVLVEIRKGTRLQPDPKLLVCLAEH